LIGVLAAVAAGFAVPLLKARLTAEKLASLDYWAGIAVKWAEANFAGSGKGAEKKEQVLEFLKGRGVILSDDELDKIVDAAVGAMNASRAAILDSGPSGEKTGEAGQ
jgi:hypothetical protein